MKKSFLNALVAFAIVSVALVSCKKTQVNNATTEESAEATQVDSVATDPVEEVAK